MKTSLDYIKKLAESTAKLEAQLDSVKKAAAILAQAQKEDRLIHVFGAETPASALIADIFFRPGAPVNIDPMVDPSLDIAHGAYRNAMCLELDGLAPCILDYYEYVKAGDPFLLLGSDAEALMFSQALEWAKKKGLVTIAVICGDSDCEADVVLHHGEKADAFDTIGGSAVGGEQTALMSALLQMLRIETAALLDKPEEQLWQGGHLCDIGANQQNIDRLLYRIRHL